MLTWAALQDAVRTVLTDFADGGRLIVSWTPESNIYVQAGQENAVLVVEAVADQFLDDRHRIGRGGEAALRSRGWTAPGAESDNWTHEIAWPARTADYEAAARMMIEALRDVYAVPGPDELTYSAWNDSDSAAKPGAALDALGMPRA